MPFISVIIPVYNTSAFIERSAKSLFDQTLDDVEFIFVDDCSIDSSYDILKGVIVNYPQRDIKVIHHETNKGSATARNTGLRNASGTYVTFADSDDYLDKEGLQGVYEVLRNNDVDILICDYCGGDDTKVLVCNQKREWCKNNVDYLKVLLSEPSYGSTCNKIYRKTFVDSTGQFFLDGADMWEDLSWNMRLVCMTNKILYSPLCYYHYCWNNPDSLIHQNSEEKRCRKIEQESKNLSVALDVFEQKGLLGELDREIKIKKLYIRDNLLSNPSKNSLKAWRHLYPESNQVIMKIKRAWAYRVILKLLSVGFNLPYLMYHKYVFKKR